jgi:hypothetical protein
MAKVKKGNDPDSRRAFGEKLVERLRVRRAEIEDAILARVRAISDSSDNVDGERLAGLRSLVKAGVAFGLAAIELGGEGAGPVPTVMLAQTRRAAEGGIGLDIVLRSYAAAFALWGQFIVREAVAAGLPSQPFALDRLQRTQAALFDRLVSAIGDAHTREVKRVSLMPEQRRAELVHKLLAGELVDSDELEYDLDAWHLGVIVVGTEAAAAAPRLADLLDCRLLLLSREEDVAWAWLGSRGRLADAALSELRRIKWPAGVSIALGVPAKGLPGWRLTHRQAEAALTVARREGRPVTRYGEVSLLAAMLSDEVLVRSLTATYLTPLASERDGGEASRETLRAYFAANRNASSAAATLGVSRQTVNNRLARIEKLLGRSPLVTSPTPCRSLDLLDHARPQAVEYRYLWVIFLRASRAAHTRL